MLTKFEGGSELSLGVLETVPAIQESGPFQTLEDSSRHFS